jgi:glutamate-1-semialdehyde 2,1-aminomutase
VARAATNRKKIVKIQEGYHGVAPWMMASMATPDRDVKGITQEDGADMHQIPWNDAQAFEQLISEHPNEIACFISSPYNHPAGSENSLPADGYWSKIENLCRQNGILLIVDDVRSGFRINLAGSNVSYGFKPDMVCFGKAIANGYPLSALVGHESLKKIASQVFYTGSHFFQAAPMAAAKATLLEMQKVDAANQMTQFGMKLNDGLVNIASQHGYELSATGIPAMPYYRLSGVAFETHAKWIDECVTRGVYLLNYHNHFISTAHDEEDLSRTFDIVNEAFKAMGDPAQYQVA